MADRTLADRLDATGDDRAEDRIGAHGVPARRLITKPPERSKATVAAVVGVGLDNEDGHQRVTRTEEMVLVGGSAAVDLCDVAAGRLDGYYERGLNPDIAEPRLRDALVERFRKAGLIQPHDIMPTPRPAIGCAPSWRRSSPATRSWRRSAPDERLSGLLERGSRWQTGEVGRVLAHVASPCAASATTVSVGDAVCTTTPNFGRGITTSLLQAQELLRLVDEHGDGRRAEYPDQQGAPHFADEQEDRDQEPDYEDRYRPSL